MPYKILILQSVRDEITARREIYIQHSPLLREHTFDYLYAMEFAALGETKPLPARVLKSQQSSLDEKELLARLTDRVNWFKPDILVVHSGSAFQSFPEQLWFVMTALKGSHPHLRIGFLPRPFERDTPKPFFEYTAEMHDLMTQIFQEQERQVDQ
jgi:hypothetical protein